MSNFIQFELWKDCNNGCKFCFNKGQPKIDKLKSLLEVKQKILSLDYKDIDGLAFIGGEFFDNQLNNNDIKTEFLELFNVVNGLLEKKDISFCFFTSSLIFDRNKYLIPFLDFLKKSEHLDKYTLCTSYDLKYRFHGDGESTWKDNMLFLKQNYSELKTHTEMILSGFFIDAVLNNLFNIRQFCDTFNTNVDFLEPESGLFYYDKQEMINDIPDFFPTKKAFIDFLKKEAFINKTIDLNRFLSPELRANTLYFNYNGNLVKFDHRRTIPKATDTSLLDVKYDIGLKDSKIAMYDIVKEMKESYNE